MPSPTYEQNKRFIYQWKHKNETNLNRARELSKLSKRKIDAFKKERTRLFHILID